MTPESGGQKGAKAHALHTFASKVSSNAAEGFSGSSRLVARPTVAGQLRNRTGLPPSATSKLSTRHQSTGARRGGRKRDCGEATSSKARRRSEAYWRYGEGGRRRKRRRWPLESPDLSSGGPLLRPEVAVPQEPAESIAFAQLERNPEPSEDRRANHLSRPGT